MTITSIPSTPLPAPASPATPAATPSPGPSALAALGAQPAPQPSAQALALSIATAVAAMRQSALAPLLADLAQAVAMPSLPAPVQQAISQVLAAQTPLEPPPNAAQLQQATASSGVFLEAQLAAGAPPQAGDLKSALLVVQQVLRTWLESASPSSPALAAPALAGLPTPPSAAPPASTSQASTSQATTSQPTPPQANIPQAVAVTQPSGPATTPPTAPSGAPFNGDPNSRQPPSNAPPAVTAGEAATTPAPAGQPGGVNALAPPPGPVIQAAVSASPTATPPGPSAPAPQTTTTQAPAPTTTSPTAAQTPAPPAATPEAAPQPSAAQPPPAGAQPPPTQPPANPPANVQSTPAPTPAIASPVAASPVVASPAALSPEIASYATPQAAAAPPPLSPPPTATAPPTAQLGLVLEAEAAPAQASAAQPPSAQALGAQAATQAGSPAPASTAAQPPPPPFRGGPTTAQPPASPSLPADADPSAVGRRLLAATSGAVARQQLHQIASLPDTPSPPSQRTAEAGSRWMFELPFATARGAAVAQFEISRDGGGGAAGQGESTWRARFSIDLEPMGPVHAQVALTGARAGVTLWAERPATAKQLRAQSDVLSAGLEDASFAAAVSVHVGAPPRTPPPAGRFLDQAS